jgi:hypothetical protein
MRRLRRRALLRAHWSEREKEPMDAFNGHPLGLPRRKA